MPCFEYGQAETDHLKRRDRRLGSAIDRIGRIEREVNPDLFAALVHSIVSQQISAKAAATVWSRLHLQCTEITPQSIAATGVDAVQKCGLSLRKAGYIQNICRTVLQKDLIMEEFPQLPDAEIIQRLSGLHGIGEWTAEMLMIFSLQRPDIVSWGDLAIRRGMMALYGLKKIDRAIFDKYRIRYSPYGSVASLYLWRIAAENPPKKSVKTNKEKQKCLVNKKNGKRSNPATAPMTANFSME